MVPYLLLFLIPSILSLFEEGKYRRNKTYINSNKWTLSFFLYYIILTLMIGLRHEVGGDWRTYLEGLEKLEIDPEAESIIRQDYAYYIINILSIHSNLGVYFLNTVSSVIFSYCLIYFCLNQNRPWLTMVVAVPYLIIVVAMGYTRQSVALGIIMCSIVNLTNGKYYKFLFLVAIAAAFHKSAVVILPFSLFLFSKKNKFTLITFIMSFILFFLVFLQEYYNTFYEAYIVSEYQSSGAEIRVIMNLIPSTIFLFLYKKFDLTNHSKKFWYWVSLFSFAFLILLQFMPSSTAIDRIALYWIPVQLYVFGSLPYLYRKAKYGSMISTLFVNFYSFMIMIVWLNFAVTAFAWLPYQFYPLKLYIDLF